MAHCKNFVHVYRCLRQLLLLHPNLWNLSSQTRRCWSSFPSARRWTRARRRGTDQALQGPPCNGQSRERRRQIRWKRTFSNNSKNVKDFAVLVPYRSSTVWLDRFCKPFSRSKRSNKCSIIVLKNMDLSHPLFVLFTSQFNYKRRCAWISNPGPQDGRRRQIDWSMSGDSCSLIVCHLSLARDLLKRVT